ncbi:hypothetical protein [Tateyamaria sp.]|uniref:hypothetical protein n=1 Tax=Tateyamaria sp. TaxID=1929288 RepID=UPI00329C7E0B
MTETTDAQTMWHQPRKLIGYDLIKGLRDLAHSRVGNRYAYDHCAVQRAGDGNILPEFNLDTMRISNSRNELTYSHLIQHAITDADRIAHRIKDMSLKMRFETLNGLLKDVRKDGSIAWVLSAACLRRLIFPQSYSEMRCDNVRYHFDDKGGALGQRVFLDSLNPQHVERFLTHAERMCPTIPLATITPLISTK